MDLYIKKKWGGILVLLLILAAMSSMAFARAVYIRCDGTNYINTNPALTIRVPVGNKVQYIKGSITCPNSANPNYMGTANSQLATNSIGDDVSGTAGQFFRFIGATDVGALPANVYARVWNVSALTSGPTVRYGNTSARYVAEAATPDTLSSASFWLNYVGDAPLAPVLTAVDPIDVGYDISTIRWRIPTASDGAEYEITRVVLSYGTNLTADNIQRDVPISYGYDSGLELYYYQFGELVRGLHLDPGTTYYVKVRADNGFGNGAAYSNIEPFTTKGMGGGRVSVVLRRNHAAGLGINSFSVPGSTFNASSPTKTVAGAPVPASITTTSITNALDLCNMINQINGGPVVRTFGTWDEVNQTEKGVVITYSGSSIANPASDFPALIAGRGYQVYIKPPDSDDTADLTLGFTLQ